MSTIVASLRAERVLPVTAVIPAYNRANLVARAITSVAMQDGYAVAEVIVVDDGSVDETGRIAEVLGARVIRQDNGGEGAARNTGMMASEQPWVAFLDSDDAWLPTHLSTLSPYLEGPRVLVASNARGVPSGRLVGHPARTPTTVRSIDVLWPDARFSPSATIVNRTEALGVGGFSGHRLGADRDTWVRLLEAGPGLILPEVTVVSFEHQDQISADQTEMRRSREDLLREYTSRPWFDRRILDYVRAVATWDEFRETFHDHQWLSASSSAMQLLRQPWAFAALKQTLSYRKALRNR